MIRPAENIPLTKWHGSEGSYKMIPFVWKLSPQSGHGSTHSTTEIGTGIMWILHEAININQPLSIQPMSIPHETFWNHGANPCGSQAACVGACLQHPCTALASKGLPHAASGLFAALPELLVLATRRFDLSVIGLLFFKMLPKGKTSKVWTKIITSFLSCKAPRSPPVPSSFHDSLDPVLAHPK